MCDRRRTARPLVYIAAAHIRGDLAHALRGKGTLRTILRLAPFTASQLGTQPPEITPWVDKSNPSKACPNRYRVRGNCAGRLSVGADRRRRHTDGFRDRSGHHTSARALPGAGSNINRRVMFTSVNAVPVQAEGERSPESFCSKIGAPEPTALRHSESLSSPDAFESVLTFAPDRAGPRAEMRRCSHQGTDRQDARSIHVIDGRQQALRKPAGLRRRDRSGGS